MWKSARTQGIGGGVPSKARWWLLAGLAMLLASVSVAPPMLAGLRAQESVGALKEQAIQAALEHVAPYVVQIETSGGTEIIRIPGRRGMIRRGFGPTSGLIVDPDGYIISSAFNFANKPSTIRVSVPGQPNRYVAKVVSEDQTRMLTLLKIDTEGKKLPVPTAAPKKEMRIGHTVLAVGRAFGISAEDLPSVSVGIISAVDRIWGKAIQTDAKVSPTNYGGPLVDLYGRVAGVLVPASPRAEGETAGFEWYDSGIGFAIPLEDINAVLPRLKKGENLKRGILGITMKGSDIYGPAVEVATVSAGSAAEKVGIKPKDTIVAINGKEVRNQAQLRHRLGSRYMGDTVSVKLLREGKEINLDKVVLGGVVAAFGQPFLGILPVRDDADPGVEVRYVYEKSPAEKAGLKVGDRILKVGRQLAPGRVVMTGIKNRDQLMGLFQGARPDQEIKIEVKRKDGKKTETLTV
jgi:serine protease Do